MRFKLGVNSLRSPTMAWRYTCLNGTLPVSFMPIITMRATQKNMMSCPVSSSAVV
jgi:hypothetical protein